VVQGQPVDKSAFSALVPLTAKKIEKARTVMVITSKKEYPITSNFPPSLEKLQVAYYYPLGASSPCDIVGKHLQSPAMISKLSTLISGNSILKF